MPSKRDPCCVAAPPPQQQQQPQPEKRDFLVEELVSEIKENLRLRARPRQRPRPTPYERPQEKPRSASDKAAAPQTEDPYEMLQQLLDSNSLVAEAVRRLREGLCPKRRFLYEDDDVIYPLPY